jgi:hypothetical protein
VVIDAIVAAPHHRSHQAEQLLFLGAEGAILEKAFEAQTVDFGDPVIHAGAVRLEFVETVGHACLQGVFWLIPPPNFYIDLPPVYSYNIRYSLLVIRNS